MVSTFESTRKVLIQLLNIFIHLYIVFIFLLFFPILLNSIIEYFLGIFIRELQLFPTHNIMFEFFYVLLSDYTISSAIISGIITGVMLFLAISVFDVKVNLDGIKFGEFNFSKFLRSLVYLPIFIGILSKFINIELSYNDFLILEEYITIFLDTFNAELNQYWQLYFITIFKMLPSVLATVYLIKLFIFEYFWWILYPLVCVHIFLIFIRFIQSFFREVYEMVILYNYIKE